MDSGIGVYAPDAGAYSTFAALFDPIIEANNKSIFHSSLMILNDQS